jgi:hypothetical protein
MNILISWSGARSRSIASILRASVQECFPDVTIWMSDVDVPLGSNWSFTLARILDNTQFGIICLTRENLNAPWLLFEAGALSKALDRARVVPYLIELRLSEITGPLGQFQGVEADRAGTRRLIGEIRDMAGSEQELDDLFDRIWGKIANAVFWRE